VLTARWAALEPLLARIDTRQELAREGESLVFAALVPPSSAATPSVPLLRGPLNRRRATRDRGLAQQMLAR